MSGDVIDDATNSGQIGAITPGVENRTQPLGLIISAIAGLRQMVFPTIAGTFALRDEFSGIWIVVVPATIVIAITFGFSYLSWMRRTFIVGKEDIRVESGVISRSASSVPYERIQDVSLEQKLLPRIFGLVEVKFETGAGGAEELKLAYLTADQGEHLRELIRERRDEEVRANIAQTHDANEGEVEPAAAPEEPTQLLFAMGSGRLFTMGVFEFSLVVIAVLFGLAQQFDFLLPFDFWDFSEWDDQLGGQIKGRLEEGRGQFSAFGILGKIGSGLAALGSLLVLGMVTGIVRTFNREWEFRLEKTVRGFRRRRGLFTKTDVVMPTHRVQAIKLGTRMVRYRFGWYNLKFVSLAQDFAGSSHVVAPFAQRTELDPIIRAAGFEPPHDNLDWHRASIRSRFDSALITVMFFGAIAIATVLFVPIVWVAIPLGLAIISVLSEYYSWRFLRHAIDGDQLLSCQGLFSPSTQIVQKVKLHSVEISQGPIAQRRGYATLVLGLAGGSFSISAIPTQRARELQKMIATSIAATDYSALNKG